MSTSSVSRTPAAFAAAPIAATASGWSHAAISVGARAASATSRCDAGSPTTGEVISSPSIPSSASASASPSLAQQTPSAPAAICRRAMSALLWVLACGRSFSPAPAANAAIAAMLRSSASTSTTSAGVFSDPPRPLPADQVSVEGLSVSDQTVIQVNH